MGSGIATPSFYADFQGLTSLKKNVKGNDPKAIREAARQFESLFTDMMLKSMRAAKLGEGLGDSDQTDFYQDMYDQQLAVQMSQGKGLGLADMLVQQLTRSGAIPGAASPAPATSHGAGASAASGTSISGPRASAIPAAGSAGKAGAASQRQRIGFVQTLEPYAQAAARQLGVSPDGLIAQAALETGWGQHVPSANGTPSHNLFGLKAGGVWRGAAVNAATVEYSRGAPATVTQSFRSYSTLQQGVNDYVTVLQRQPGFHAALGTGEDIASFATALARGGYATDPDYVQKLVATTQTVKQLRAGSAVTASALKPGAAAPITRGGDSA